MSVSGDEELRAEMWAASWSAGGAGVPPVQEPCLTDEATDGDDGIGEIEVSVGHVFFAFVAAL
ncbi:hypothetical protein [Micromonospora olivasterospora]|uniref:hypothetical protein n=1 Tax=Micromonospora olivasterospora TaxID=1880 RepID=UPI00119E799A|nr:hypothetical protein [Micromonospora olivasterospora]